jgi:hypothetical protein
MRKLFMNNLLAPLPVDIGSFRKLRTQGYKYVDKTQHVYNLITSGECFFLSRPRRFGKSLLVATLKELLSGNRELFKGLWIDASDYAWHKHGVIALDLSTVAAVNAEALQRSLCKQLARIAKDYRLSVTLDGQIPGDDLADIVDALRDQFDRIAILIDEYDSPILSTLKDPEKSLEIRDALRPFFAAIKGLEEKRNFVFVTGVSTFSKVSLFSGFNNLQTITTDEQFAAICGYTQEEVDTYFADYIEEWCLQKDIARDELRSKLREWYNGYRFSRGITTLYNPFSLMYALKHQECNNYWFESGSPSFLVGQLKELQAQDFLAFQDIMHPETMLMSRDDLGVFEVGNVPVPALMFQTGYFTLNEYNQAAERYTLRFPNSEVQRSLQLYMMSIMVNITSGQACRKRGSVSEQRRRFSVECESKVLR